VAIVGDSTEVMGDVGGWGLGRNFPLLFVDFANPSFLANAKKIKLHIPFFWGKKIIQKNYISPTL